MHIPRKNAILTHKVIADILDASRHVKIHAMSGISIPGRSGESRGQMKRGDLAGRNPPVSVREERQRLPPLAGKTSSVSPGARRMK
jgi:hypothetical protein